MIRIFEIVRRHFRKAKLKIIDANAHVGGFTLWWAEKNPADRITSIEIDPIIYRALCANIKHLQLDNIEPVLGDSNIVVFERARKVDFIYIDPPWGGPDYIRQPRINLHMGNVTVANFIRRVQREKLARIAVLKMPINFDIRELSKFRYELHPIYRPGRTDRADFIVAVINLKSKN